MIVAFLCILIRVLQYSICLPAAVFGEGSKHILPYYCAVWCELLKNTLHFCLLCVYRIVVLHALCLCINGVFVLNTN